MVTGVDDDVVQVHQENILVETEEDNIHQTLKGYWRVAQPEGHGLEAVCPVTGDKGGL